MAVSESIIRHGRGVAWLSVLAVALGAIGCGGGTDRVAISGTASYGGEPIKDGQIAFTPQGGGQTGIGAIVDGSYSIPADRGPSPGPALVRITANRPTGRKVKPSAYAPDQTPQEVYEQFLPAKYNESSELVVEIPDQSSTMENFELTAN